MKTLAEQNLKQPIEAHNDCDHNIVADITTITSNETTIKLVTNKMNAHIEIERQQRESIGAKQKYDLNNAEKDKRENKKKNFYNESKKNVNNNNNTEDNLREENVAVKENVSKSSSSNNRLNNKILQRDRSFELDDEDQVEPRQNGSILSEKFEQKTTSCDLDGQKQRPAGHDVATVVEKLHCSTASEFDKHEKSGQINDDQQQVVKQEQLKNEVSTTTTTIIDDKKIEKTATSGQSLAEIGPVKKFTVDCLLYVIKGIINTYDLISWPIYFIQQGVSRKQRDIESIRSKKIDPNDPDSPWRQIDISPHQIEIERKIDSFKTYDVMMESSFKSNAADKCYGYRQIIEERWFRKPEAGGKLLRQVKLNDYKWCTYGQFNQQIEAARLGFLRDGVRAGQRVILFADTRAEWQIVSQALIRLGAIVCTMYSTLGVDGIIHTCKETEASLVVTQHDKVERLLGLCDKLPNLKKVIYFDKSLHLPSELGGQPEDDEYIRKNGSEATFKGQEHVECMSFTKLLALGLRPQTEHDAELEEKDKVLLEGRTKESLALIMYTSGSTGIPKGVLISHGNIMATVKSFSYVTKDFVNNPKENVCSAYLPLAHIFEFCIESVLLYHGVSYGFATPHTLTDKSPGLVPGEKGDLSALQPTVMIIVPLILDRVVQGVKQALKAESYFKEQFVSYLIEYKSYWQKRYYETPIVNKIVCSKIARALGGRAKFVICGSAPLSSQTQTFVRAALNLRLPQGFGTTETCAATACQLFQDQSTQNVGLPVAGAQIKLEPWNEGNYRPDDKPNPRGEIVVGGQMIAQGYFNLEDQTKEAFYVDNEGTRWYRTGDIGEFLPNGQLKIIDRKKDLVKLQNGEYISLGRVESTLKSNPYTDNFCVYADSNQNYIVALGPANELAISELAKQIVEEHDNTLNNLQSTAKRQGLADPSNEREGLLLRFREEEAAMLQLREILATYQNDSSNNNEPSSKSFQSQTNERLMQLCSNKLIVDRVLKHICKMAKERNLMSLEIPKKILLIPEEWTEDKNVVTAAMKIRRNYIYKRYEHELERMYSPAES